MSLLRRLEEIVGYCFRAPPSTHQESGLLHRHSFQRLEFLGDRVLSLVVANMLYAHFPDDNEGDLTLRLSHLVCAPTLRSMADTMGLTDWAYSARLELQRKSHAKGDVLEAVIGAIYLDGGLQAAEQFVFRNWRPLLTRKDLSRQDAKTALQEWAQGRGHGLPSYSLSCREGPAHAPRFTVTVAIADYPQESGEGPSIRAAETAAAERFLRRMSSKPGSR